MEPWPLFRSCTAVGTAEQSADYLSAFAATIDADELMVVHASPGIDARLRSVELLAEKMSVEPDGAQSG